MTFGVTGVIKWPFKTFSTFFQNPRNDFLRVSSCCARILEHLRWVAQVYQLLTLIIRRSVGERCIVTSVSVCLSVCL